MSDADGSPSFGPPPAVTPQGYAAMAAREARAAAVRVRRAHRRRFRAWSVYGVVLLLFLAVIGTSWAHLAIVESRVRHEFGPMRDWWFDWLMDRRMNRPVNFFLAALMPAALCATAALTAAAALSPVPLTRRLRLVKPHATGTIVTNAATGTLALSLLLACAAQALSRGHGPANGVAAAAAAVRSQSEYLYDVFHNAHGDVLMMLLIQLCVAAPVCEELVFRGYVQTRLEERHWRWVAIVVPAVLFGALHLDPERAAYTSIIGVYLGWIASRTGSVWTSVLGHAVNNLGILVLSRIIDSLGEWWLIGSAGYFLFCFRSVLHNTPKRIPMERRRDDAHVREAALMADVMERNATTVAAGPGAVGTAR